MHLAAEKACEVLPRNLDYMARETHNWFAWSTKRLIQYATLYNLLTGRTHPLKIPSLSGTRWLVREKVTTTIVDQYDILK